MQGGIEIVAAKIEIARGEKRLAGGIIALPDHIENMPPDTLRHIDRKPVGVAVEHGSFEKGQRFEICPLERLGGVVGALRDERLKVAWRMRRGRGEAAIVAAGLHLRRRPIQPHQIKPRIFRATRARELAVGDQLRVVALRNQQAHFVPIVKGLRSCDRHGGFANLARRLHGIFQKHLIDPADRIRHGAVGEARDGGSGEQAE